MAPGKDSRALFYVLAFLLMSILLFSAFDREGPRRAEASLSAVDFATLSSSNGLDIDVEDRSIRANVPIFKAVVFDLLGHKVQTVPRPVSSYAVELSDVPPGTYFVEVEALGGRRGVIRMSVTP